jgi:hypothetical protein
LLQKKLRQFSTEGELQKEIKEKIELKREKRKNWKGKERGAADSKKDTKRDHGIASALSQTNARGVLKSVV